MDWYAMVLEPVKEALRGVMGFLPNLLGALTILFVGWLIAKTLERFVVRLLKTLRIDSLAEQVWLADALKRGGIKRTAAELIGALVYWLLILIVLMSALNALQLTVAAALLSQIVGYLPNVVAAVFILIIGIFAAVFIGTTVRTAASNAGLAPARLLGQLTQVAIVTFASVAAMQQLGIQFIGEAFKIVLAALCVGLALSFGLGCQHLAGKWVESLVEQIRSRKS